MEGRIKKWTAEDLESVVWVIWGTETCSFLNNKTCNSFLLKMNAFNVLGIRKKKEHKIIYFNAG